MQRSEFRTGHSKTIFTAGILSLLLVLLAACNSVTSAPDNNEGRATLQGEVFKNVLPASGAKGAIIGGGAVSHELSAAAVGNWVRIPSFNASDAITRITKVTTVSSGRRIDGQAKISHYAGNCVAVIARPGYSGPFYRLYERCNRLNNAGFTWWAKGRNATTVEFKICGRQNASTLICGRSGRVYTNR